MRFLITFFLGLCLSFCCIAQDTTVSLSPGMEVLHAIHLGSANAWIFRKGNDANWAKEGIDMAGWTQLRPADLSSKLADREGKLEGWFRIRIKLDTAFKDTTLELFMNTWAACELYVDGKLLHAFGNTGTNGQPFKEYNPTYKLPRGFNVQTGQAHLLALHFVDFVSSLPPYRLKSEDQGRNKYFILITTPPFNTDYFNSHMETHFFRAIWLSANVVLCLLFWLLVFQNPAEKNLLLIAITSTVITLTVYSDPYTKPVGLSYNADQVLALTWSLSRSIGTVLALVIMLRIFRKKRTLFLNLLLAIVFLCGPVERVFYNNIPIICQTFLVICIYAYYIIVCWTTLKGAQWAVLAGVLLAITFGLALAITSSVMPGPNATILVLYTGLFLSAPLSLLVYVAIRFKEIINEVRRHATQIVQLSEEKKEQALNQQKILQDEVNRQTAELRATLEDLRSTQAQLIQSEKMASLGELTAGIAHEIQNPLNFVNNFSEVNTELIDEAGAEIENGNVADAKTILHDIKDNEEKISYHGKRADAIVKSMLQHSRSSSGKKELTDINALCDEYLRLAYHGLRAKDKSFNAKFETDFDGSIGSMNIVPQDVGRVILNLINNAFYAVSEKAASFKRQAASVPAEQPPYEPLVVVQTKRLNEKIEIRVSDNGNGIPAAIKEKVFQPFFTTKPTGQGTGLGLSLSYDIVKAHGGEIAVTTKEGEGSEFVIHLPLTDPGDTG